MNYHIRSLGYDPESDELDLLINADHPHAAESIAVDHGVYIRRELTSGAVVGAFIRGYRQFARAVAVGQPLDGELAQQASLAEVFHAIVVWQREIGALSYDLAAHLGAWPPQDKLMQVLVSSPEYK